MLEVQMPHPSTRIFISSLAMEGGVMCCSANDFGLSSTAAIM
jgi:hypothetical protein